MKGLPALVVALGLLVLGSACRATEPFTDEASILAVTR
jgi:hypothetical protein